MPCVLPTWMSEKSCQSIWFLGLLCVLVASDVVAKGDRWLRAYAEVTVSEHGQIQKYQIRSDTPEILRDLFRTHLDSLEFQAYELESASVFPAEATLTAYYRLSRNKNGDFSVLLDDKALRFRREEILSENEKNSDVITLVRINPGYPEEALYQGIAGWVELEFTITEKGTVKDIVVVHASHERLFRKEAKRALKRWKFKPRVIDGKPVARRASQTIDFSMEH